MNERILLEAMSQATLREDPRDMIVASLAEFRTALTERLQDVGMASASTHVAAGLAAMLDGIVIHRLLDPTVDASRAIEARTAEATTLQATSRKPNVSGVMSM